MKNQLFLFLIQLSIYSFHTTQAQVYYYYTGASPTINSNSCPVSTCTQCATGRYNEGCGLDANKLNTQNCKDCVGLPSNAEWTAWGAYPDGIGLNSSICKWNCKYQYILTNGNCVRGNCSVAVQNAELTPGADYPNCTTRCKAGYFGTKLVDPTDCSSCSAGSFAVAGATSCSQCPKGTYLDTPNGKDLSECKSAPAGTYTSTDGSATPQKCPAGTFSSAVGATSISTCGTCPVGHYCPEGSGAPVPCPAGKFTNFTGGTNPNVCESCAPGTYLVTPGGSACTPCAAGTFSTVQGATNSSVCGICPAGGYCPLGSSAVTLCSTGTYSASVSQGSAIACQACPQFTYNLVTGATACLPCQFCSLGEYRSGCGGSTEGVCSRCTNTPA